MIDGCVDASALLGRHVGQRALDPMCQLRPQCRSAQPDRQPQIDQARLVARLHQQQVVRVDIAVDDAGFVQPAQCGGDGAAQVEPARQGEPLAGHQLGQRDATGVLHDQCHRGANAPQLDVAHDGALVGLAGQVVGPLKTGNFTRRRVVVGGRLDDHPHAVSRHGAIDGAARGLMNQGFDSVAGDLHRFGRSGSGALRAAQY